MNEPAIIMPLAPLDYIARTLDKRVHLKIIITSKTYVVWPQLDSSFEHPKQMLKLMDKNIHNFTLNFFGLSRDL